MKFNWNWNFCKSAASGNEWNHPRPEIRSPMPDFGKKGVKKLHNGLLRLEKPAGLCVENSPLPPPNHSLFWKKLCLCCFPPTVAIRLLLVDVIVRSWFSVSLSTENFFDSLKTSTPSKICLIIYKFLSTQFNTCFIHLWLWIEYKKLILSWFNT